MSEIKMDCYVCDKRDWENLGNVTEMPDENSRDFLVCKNCGNAALSVDPSKEKEILEHYRKTYRPEPTHVNLLTTTNKKNYIMAFLDDFLKDAKEKGKTLVCGDVGCATGYIPAALRERGHKATGCELTLTFRRFAEHYYGIPVTEELEEKHKYDLISIYHVLEHMMKPDEKLKKYRDMLSDDGMMLISTPEWFTAPLEVQSGENLKGVWHLFHRDHINVFSSVSLKNLFKKVGLEIVKEDHVTYGQGYLLKKCEPSEITKEDFNDVVADVKRICKAVTLFKNGKAAEAIDEYGAFPEAYLHQIFNTAAKEPDRQAELFGEAKKTLKNNARLRAGLASWLFQNERWADAGAVYSELLQVRPNAQTLFFLGHCHAQLGKKREAMQCYLKASELDPTKWAEYQSFACHMAATLPTFDERAAVEIKEKLFAEAAPEIKPVDPVMKD